LTQLKQSLLSLFTTNVLRTYNESVGDARGESLPGVGDSADIRDMYETGLSQMMILAPSGLEQEFQQMMIRLTVNFANNSMNAVSSWIKKSHQFSNEELRVQSLAMSQARKQGHHGCDDDPLCVLAAARFVLAFCGAKPCGAQPRKMPRKNASQKKKKYYKPRKKPN